MLLISTTVVAYIIPYVMHWRWYNLCGLHLCKWWIMCKWWPLWPTWFHLGPGLTLKYNIYDMMKCITGVITRYPAGPSSRDVPLISNNIAVTTTTKTVGHLLLQNVTPFTRYSVSFTRLHILLLNYLRMLFVFKPFFSQLFWVLITFSRYWRIWF